ncbi:MAG: hypothetical protein ACOZFS_15135 [Thermodesulfobacteriota bacterium]
MEDNENFGLRVLERARTKRQSEAERLFSQYCKPQSGLWRSLNWRQPALAILGSGIFIDNTLKGHARHKKNYPIDLGDLIYFLVETHLDYDIIPPILHLDIIKSFEEYFDLAAGIARLGGVRESQIEKIKQTWREKISTKVVEGKISPHWRHVLTVGTAPKEIYYRFADILISQTPQAPPNRIADWVNAILKALERDPVSKSILRDYIGREQQRILNQTPITITE